VPPSLLSLADEVIEGMICEVVIVLNPAATKRRLGRP
jgi:hypothetical protein